MQTIKPTSIRLDLEVQKKLEKYAKKEDRSVSKVINRILRSFFKLPAQKT